MAKYRSRDLAVGGFAALALIVLAVGIMAVGGESRLFVRKVPYRAVFTSVDGVIIGSPVKISGVTVGTVSAVRLPVDPGAQGIEVNFGIEQAYGARVREGSTATLRFLQYLSGEKYIEVAAGDPTRPELAPGSLIPTDEGSQFLEKGEDITENLAAITVSVKKILEPLERGEGILGEMLRDPEFGKEGLTAARETLENLSDLTGSLRKGEGFAGRLFSDPELADRAESLGKSMDDLAAILEQIRGGQGTVGDLLADDGDSRQTLADLKATAASLRRFSESLESREGMVGRLLNDSAYSEQMAADLRTSLRNLAEITTKINEGKGTLGLLVNDRALHDGATQVIAGMGDSKFANWLLRRYQKKGIEAQDEQAPATPPEGP